jgi:hypothetical protein
MRINMTGGLVPNSHDAGEGSCQTNPKQLRFKNEEVPISPATKIQAEHSPRNASDELPLTQEIFSNLSLSFFIYKFADSRRHSILGNSPISFEDLVLPSDKICYTDIIKGNPHPVPAYSAIDNPSGDVGGIPRLKLFAVIMKLTLRDYEEEIKASRRRLPRVSTFAQNSYFTDSNKYFGEWRAVMRVRAYMRKSRVLRESINEQDSLEKGFQVFAFFNHQCKKALKDCIKPRKGETTTETVFYIRQLLHALKVKDDISCQKCLQAIRDDDYNAMANSMPLVADHILKQGSPLNMYFKLQKRNDQLIVWINDRMEHAECVYSIIISRRLRRVNLVFRGSANWSDVTKNVDCQIDLQKNPIADDYPGKTDEIELRSGYSSYLFRKRKDTLKTKWQEIADRCHEYGKEIAPDGYSLHVTGHSMGGALASMFGFFASTDKRFAQQDNPIRVYTFNAAIAGCISFARAFQHQERVGLLRYARVINKGDIVPYLRPPYGRETYAHTGITIRIPNSKGNISLKYVEDVDWWRTWRAQMKYSLLLNLSLGSLRPTKVNSYHSISKSTRRLEDLAMHGSLDNDMSDKTLNSQRGTLKKMKSSRKRMDNRTLDDYYRILVEKRGLRKSRKSGLRESVLSF